MTNIRLDQDVNENVTLSVNDTLICMADGNPSPDISWEKVEGEGEADIEGAVLVITEDMAGHSHQYKCAAENIVTETRHEITELFSFFVGRSIRSTQQIKSNL